MQNTSTRVPGRHGWRAWLAAFSAVSLGLALRLFFLLRFPRTDGDPALYLDLARTLLERHVYGFTRVVGGVLVTHPSLIRLPGYPLFLALCFALFGHGNVRAVLLVQTAVDLGTCALAALTATRLFGSRAGWFALWLAVLCPFTATYVAAPLTETLVLFTIALALYALVRWRQSGRQQWLWWMGAALGYSTLLRPDQGLLTVAVVLAVLWSSPGRGLRRLEPALSVLALALIALLPWTIRNERTMHVFQPLAPKSAGDPGEPVSNGFDRWYRTFGIEFATNETVYWAYNSDPILLENLPDRAFDSDAQRQETARLLDDYNETTTQSNDFDRRFEALARERMRAHPFRTQVLLPAARVLDMLLRPRTEMLPFDDVWWKPRPDWGPTLAVALAYGGLNLLYLVLAMAGLYQWRRLASDRRVAAPVVWSMVLSILLRLGLLLTLDNAEPRYTLELYPILFVLGGAWLGGAGLPKRGRMLSEI